MVMKGQKCVGGYKEEGRADLEIRKVTPQKKCVPRPEN